LEVDIADGANYLLHVEGNAIAARAKMLSFDDYYLFVRRRQALKFEGFDLYTIEKVEGKAAFDKNPSSFFEQNRVLMNRLESWFISALAMLPGIKYAEAFSEPIVFQTLSEYSVVFDSDNNLKMLETR